MSRHDLLERNGVFPQIMLCYSEVSVFKIKHLPTFETNQALLIAVILLYKSKLAYA
jgi:hypothetical protein